MAGYFCIATDAAIGFAISWVLKYNLKAYDIQGERRESEDDMESFYRFKLTQ